MPVLELPASLIRYIMENVYGETDPALYDQPTWDETAAKQQAAVAGGMKWAVRFSPRTFSDFCQQVAEQSNADLYQSGGLWVYRWRQARDPVATFTTARNLTTKPVYARVPPRTGLSAKLKYSWDVNFATQEYRKSEVLTSGLVGQLSNAQIGRRVRSDQPIELLLEFVWHEDTARLLARKKLARIDRQRWAVHLTSDWDAIPIEKGDAIFLDAPFLSRFFGTSRVTFVVTAKRYTPGTDAIEIDAEETEPLALELPLRWAVRSHPVMTRVLAWTVHPRLALPLRWRIAGEPAIMDGAVLATAMVHGSLAELVGHVSASAIVTGNLQSQASFAGAISASTTVAGTLTIGMRFSGAASASAVATGDLSTLIPPLGELTLLGGV
jgi:hypothetical protein